MDIEEKDLKEIESALVGALKIVRKSIRQVGGQQDSSGTPTPKDTPKKIGNSGLAGKTATSVPASELVPPPDLDDPEWPECISENLIIRSDADDTEKRFRALQITGLLGVEYAGRKILDFGCGEGHVAAEMALTAKRVVGYDIKHYQRVEKSTSQEKLVFAESMKDVVREAPYDVILLYDVLDHLEGTDPSELMKDLAGLLSDNGIIQCRCHPWTSRHGGHLYEQKNLAYLHLMLTTSELLEAGIKGEPNLKITKPMSAYTGWFKAAGLTIESKKSVTETPPEFISKHINRIIQVNWAGRIQPDMAMKILANQFLDYTLVRL